MGHRRLRRASEAGAVSVLESLGYRILDVRAPLLVGGVEVSDIDVVAEKDGERYAVEVKAGKADLHAVRQAYVNARLAGMKPLIVARGADEKALAAAKELGVEIITLPDLLYAGYEDLRQAVQEAVLDAILQIAATITACKSLPQHLREAMKAVAESPTIQDLANRLNTTPEEAAKIIAELRRRGALLNASYQTIHRQAALTLALCEKI